MVFGLWLQCSPRLLGRAFLLVGGAEMKKILFSFLLASSFSLSAATNPIDPDPQVDALERIFQVLNSWADQYPQCYQDVADIKQAISDIQNLTSVSISEMSAFHGDFANLHSELGPHLVAYENYLKQISDFLPGFHTDSGAIQAYLSDLVYYHSSDTSSYYLSSMNEILSQLSTLISDHYSKLPDFNTWSPEAKVTNFADIKEILRELFNEITVYAHCTLDSDAQIKVNAQFDFNYDYFSPLIRFSEKSNKGYFSLNTFTRYHPSSWLFNENDSMDSLVTPIDSSTVGVDFLDFMCSCGNALVSQNQDISMLLCQMLGFYKQGHEDMDELKRLATSASDGASQDLDSLKSAFHASSLEDVAAQYFVDLSIDEKFDTDFLGFGHGSGSSCPDFIDIGPIPFSKIHSSMSDYTLHFSTAGLKSFFDICRQCFTVVWYLFFLTICIFLGRFGWAFLKPILRTLTSVLNW